ncbi:endonuclease [Mycolicibacterium litorale]|nr:endonuclease [Mycolicibacterium litorale]
MAVRHVLPTLLSALLLVFVVLALIARIRPITTMPALVLAVGSPYVFLGGVFGAMLAARRKQAILAVAAVVVSVVSLTVQVPWYYLGRPVDTAPHIELRVLSSNLRKGQADPAFLVALANNNADVITVAELTPEEVRRLKRAGIKKTFPYSHLLPGPGAGGVGMWSRYPLTILSVPRHRRVRMPAARLNIPGVRFDPVLASVHAYSPVAGERNTVGDWRIGMAGAKAQLRTFNRIAGPGAVIVGGDYNSTPDMRQFRDLLTDGYRDAVEQTGSGFAPTYPSDTWYPPLITIDHVLTHNAAASSVRTITVPGSDHRALLTTVQVPVDPTAS